VGFSSAFFLTIKGEMDKSRLVLAGLAMTVIGAVAVSFGVTHNVVFSVAFGGGFGTRDPRTPAVSVLDGT
jgi:hypothetical protein